MNTITNLLHFLILLNKRAYNYWFHTSFLAVWVFALATLESKPITIWIYKGLSIWALLSVYRIIYEIVRDYTFYDLKQKVREHGFLQFLVGLNIAVLLGPLSVILFLILTFLPRED